MKIDMKEHLPNIDESKMQRMLDIMARFDAY